MNYSKSFKFSDDEIKHSETVLYLDNLYKQGNIMRLYNEFKDESRVIFKKCNIKEILKHKKFVLPKKHVKTPK
jgi:hypothetical protein